MPNTVAYCDVTLISGKRSNSKLQFCTLMSGFYFHSHLITSLSAFDGEHCYEPYLPHGNFSSSDITFPLGTIVTFSCSPGFVMEQGSGVMECVDPNDPHWNESEPVCRGITLYITSYLTQNIPVKHLYTTNQKFGVSKITFFSFQQGSIKFIKSDSKDFYVVIK